MRKTLLTRVWALEIRRFEKADKKAFPPKNAILFTGSSTIRMWNTLEEDMAPLDVINRGFGGARILDVNYYFERIVTPYDPKGIVFYCGENDIAGLLLTKCHTAEQVLDLFGEFCDKCKKEFPHVKIFFISIKPPQKRLEYWNEMQKANGLISDYCESNEGLYFIDIVPILSEGGKIKEGISRKDGIHLNEEGYKLITSVIKPVLWIILHNG